MDSSLGSRVSSQAFKQGNLLLYCASPPSGTEMGIRECASVVN